MTATPKKYWIVMALAGVVLVGAGLGLTALSNPRRFSLDPRADVQINLLAASGFVCTIAGIGLLLTAGSFTTKSMPRANRLQANLGVGMGIVLQLAGFYLHHTATLPDLVGLALILMSIPAFIWGGMNYAEGKGHSKWVGLLGVAGILGLVILIVLPDRHAVQDDKRVFEK